MPTQTVGVAQVLAALRRAVKRRGKTHVGRQGVYFKDNEPACLLGDVIYNEWGVGYDDLGHYANSSGVSMLVGRLADKGIKFTPEAQHVLRVAQQQNDRGMRWGDVFQNSITASKDPVTK